MKKDKTEKKEKKERKEGKLKSIKESGAGSSSSSSSSSSSNRKLTADELLRLDEVRRSLKIRTRRKEKEKLPSGITADYTANFNLATDDQQQQQQQPASSNSETSLNSLSKDVSAASATSAASAASLPPPPPLVPSRGILKGKSSYGAQETSSHDLEDDKKLVENTLKNELIIYEKPPPAVKAAQTAADPAATATASASVSASVSASASASSTAGEGYGWADGPCGKGLTLGEQVDQEALCLPPLVEMALPEARDLKLFRKDTGDFGFSLRRSVVVERPSNQQLDNRYILDHR